MTVRSKASIVRTNTLTGRLHGWIMEVRKTIKGRVYKALTSPNGKMFPSREAALRYIDGKHTKPNIKKRVTKPTASKMLGTSRLERKHMILKKKKLRKRTTAARGELINEEGDQVPRGPQRAANQNVPHFGAYPAGDDLPNWTIEHAETTDGTNFLLYRDPNGRPVGSRGTALLMTGQLEVPLQIRDQVREQQRNKHEHTENLKHRVGLAASAILEERVVVDPCTISNETTGCVESDDEPIASTPNPQSQKKMVAPPESKWQRGELSKLYDTNFSRTNRKKICSKSSKEKDLASKLVIVDLFCGIGGFSLGASSLGSNHIIGFDNECGCIAAYRANECGQTSLQQTLRAQDVDKWVEILTPLKDSLVILASPPCQPYSCTGVGNGSSDERDGMPFVIEICARVKPLALILENVPALLNERHSDVVEPQLDRLRNAGFSLTIEVASCTKHAVAQRRKRAIVLAIRAEFSDTPLSMKEQSATRLPSAGDVLHDTPHLWDGKCPAELQVSAALLRSRHRLRPGCESTGVARFNTAAPTVLTTALHDNSYYRMVAIPYDIAPDKIKNGDLRNLTIVHLLRLQGFPNDYVLFNHVRFQSHCVGNAIPPPLAQAAFECILNALDSANVEPTHVHKDGTASATQLVQWIRDCVSECVPNV